MKHYINILFVGLLAYFGWAGHGFASNEMSSSRPNIIFLMSDDQSTYSLGCYGNKDVATPNIDKLSAEGMTFDRHYDTTAVCMASRANVMAGMYEYKTGCNFPQGNMMLKIWNKSYPVLLREAGYTTAFAGKFGFDIQESPDGEVIGLPEKDFDRLGGSPHQTSYNTKENKAMAPRFCPMRNLLGFL